MPIFPETRRSIIANLKSEDAALRQRALDIVLRVYRAPVVSVLQAQWHLGPEDAEDLAHDFFLKALTNDWLARYDASKARFRTFLRQCLHAYANTAHQASTRLKRGGHLRPVSLDDALHVADNNSAQDELFEREWVRSVLEAALEDFRKECEQLNRVSSYDVFIALDVESLSAEHRPTYAAVGHRFGLPPTQVTNFINWSRRRFRHHVLETLRSLTVDDEEFRDEARVLLGVDVA